MARNHVRHCYINSTLIHQVRWLNGMFVLFAFTAEIPWQETSAYWLTVLSDCSATTAAQFLTSVIFVDVNRVCTRQHWKGPIRLELFSDLIDKMITHKLNGMRCKSKQMWLRIHRLTGMGQEKGAGFQFKFQVSVGDGQVWILWEVNGEWGTIEQVDVRSQGTGTVEKVRGHLVDWWRMAGPQSS